MTDPGSTPTQPDSDDQLRWDSAGGPTAELPVYATTADMEPRWLRLTGRPLTEEQRGEAADALQLAGILIRRNVDMAPADPTTRAERTVIARDVSIDMVVAALAVGYEVYGKRSYSSTVGGIADSATLVNPAASMVITEAHLAMFRGTPATTPLAHFGDTPL